MATGVATLPDVRFRVRARPVAAVGAGAVFVGVQAVLGVHNHHVYATALAARSITLGPPDLPDQLLAIMEGPLLAFVALALAAALAIAAGRPCAALIPACAWVTVPAIVDGFAALRPVGANWIPPLSAGSGRIVAGAVGDVVLVAFAGGLPFRRGPASPRIRPDAAAVLAAGVAAGTVVLCTFVAPSRVGHDVGATQIALVASTFGAGMLVRPRPGAYAGLGLVAVGLAIAEAGGPTMLTESGPLLVAGALAAAAGAATSPLARAARGLQHRPGLAVVVCNLLNVLDAVVTAVWLETGAAREANPVVTAIGLPAKIVAVALFSVVVARWAPRLLIVPIATLVLVAVWHVAGILSAAGVVAG